MSEAVKGRAWDGNRGYFHRNLAVVIGIDLYQNDSIKDLSTAVSDARAIAHLLEQEYDYKQSDEKPEVIRLFDKDATLEALQHLFHTRIPQELNPRERDRLIIYYAGHGLPRSNDDGPEGYLVPHNADPTKPELFLAMRDVSEALSKLKCHHLLVILDCCFAGTFRWAGSRKAVPILETIRREHYYHFIRHPAWQVITSSAHDQEALDVARLKEDNRKPVPGLSEPHSPFALAILEGLQTGNDSQRVNADLYPDGVVTAHELFVYLQNRVKELSGERQNPGIFPLRQEYDKGEFIFTRPEFDPQNLAEALPLNEDNNPYRGLNSFDEKHARFFFGRQALIEELAKRLAQPNQALMVVLGVSGSGKSSLVKAGLIPYLRDQHLVQICLLELLIQFPPSPLKLRLMSQIYQWCILDPMRPGESPFMSLARTLLPIADEGLLERLAEVSFLDDIFQPMLESKAESGRDSDNLVLGKQAGKPPATQPSLQANETLMKVADSWCSATPEAKLLLIEDYFAQLETLGTSQQKDQLKELYDRILAELDSVSQQLQQEPQYFSRAIATWSQKHSGVRLFLVIDQFEELLTRSQDDRKSSNQTQEQEGESTEQKEWQEFLEVLRIAIADHPQTLRLVLTLRSDFEPRFLTSTLEPYWKDARFPVRAMTSDELRQAIENPALKQALYFEELKDEKGNTIGNLVSKLVDEVGQMPGALPLLSFTLSELYVSLYRRWQVDRSTDRTLRFADYETLGGVAGALTRRATQEYDALDENHQGTMRQVMLRMVTIEGGGVARRRVPETELVYAALEENKRVAQVIDRLVKARLLVKGQETGESYVEPAHDFLVRGWDKLQGWIKEEQGNLTLQQRLTPAASDWHKNEQNSEYLWIRDPRLAVLEKVLESETNNWLNQLEVKFVETSKQKRIDELEETKRQLRISEERRKSALARQLAAQAELVRGTSGASLIKSLVLAVQSVNEKPTFEGEQALRKGLSLLPNSVINTTDIGEIIAVTFSPDGRYFASVSSDKTVRVWKTDNSQLLTSWTENKMNLEDKSIPEEVISITLSNEGNYIGIGGNTILRVREVRSRQKMVDFNIGFPSQHISISPDGKYIAVAAKKIAQVRAIDSNCEIENFSYTSDDVSISNIALSDQGKHLAMVVDIDEASIVAVWDVTTHRETKLTHNSARQLVVSFSLDGKYLVTGGDEPKSDGNRVGQVRIFNATDLEESTRWDEIAKWNQDDFPEMIAFSSGLELGDWEKAYYLATTTSNTTQIWRFSGFDRIELISRMPSENPLALAFSLNGEFLNLISNTIFETSNNLLCRWQVDNHQQVLKIYPDQPFVEGLAFSPDGHFLNTLGSGKISRWNIKIRNSIVNCSPDSNISSIGSVISSDGRYVAWQEDATDVCTLNIATGNKTKFSFPDSEGVVKCVAISSEGKYLAIAMENVVKLLDRETNSQVAKISLQKPIGIINFSLDGAFLAIDSEDTINIWKCSKNSCSEVASIPQNSPTKALALSRDGKNLAIASGQTIQVLQISDSQTITRIENNLPFNAVAFSWDSKYLATANQNYSLIPSPEDFAVKVWLLSSEDLVDEAGSRLMSNLNLTQLEWEQYLISQSY